MIGLPVQGVCGRKELSGGGLCREARKAALDVEECRPCASLTRSTLPALFSTVARRPPQHEMAECRGDRFCRVVLPGLGLERDHASALLDDRGTGVTVERAAGAQVVDGEPDRLGQRRDAELARDA